jgi:ferredoxin, 2Fe-2S
MGLQRFLVRFEPTGATVEVLSGTSLFDAALKAGITMPAICGGQCDCGECRILVLDGELTPVTREEEHCLGACELNQGMRLACCARILGDTRVHV